MGAGRRRRDDLYDMLGVTPEAPPEVIRAAYRALAAKYHPDRNPGDPKAGAKLKRINAAYEVLGDPDKRRDYDQSRTAHDEDAAASNEPEPAGSAPGSDPTARGATGGARPSAGPASASARAQPAPAQEQAAPRAPAARVKPSGGSRVLVAAFAVVVSLCLTLSGPFGEPMNSAAQLGFVAGLGALGLVVYALSGRVRPSECAAGIVLIAALVYGLRTTSGWTFAAPAATATAATVSAPPSPGPTAAPTHEQETMVLYGHDGEPIDVALDDVPYSLMTGNFGLPKHSKIPIVLRDGSVVIVPVEQAITAFKKGARVATSEEAANARPAATVRPRPAPPPAPTSDRASAGSAAWAACIQACNEDRLTCSLSCGTEDTQCDERCGTQGLRCVDSCGSKW